MKEKEQMIEHIIDFTGKALFVATVPWVVYFFLTVWERWPK